MGASIITVFYSTQIQRDKRISWQLLLSFLCLWANLFIFWSAMQIIPHFFPILIIWFWTMPVGLKLIFTLLKKKTKKGENWTNRQIRCQTGCREGRKQYRWVSTHTHAQAHIHTRTWWHAHTLTHTHIHMHTPVFFHFELNVRKYLSSQTYWFKTAQFWSVPCTL